MLALKYLLMILGAVLFGSSAGLVAYDILLSTQLRRLLRRGTAETDAPGTEPARRPFRPVRWRLAVQLAAAGGLALLVTQSVAVVPDGGRRAGQPNLGRAPRYVVSGSASGYAIYRRHRDV
jgi:hypothetical protein